MARIVAKLGEGGRIVIPAVYRKALGVRAGDELILSLEEGTVRILTPREAIRRAQAAVRAHVSPGRSLADELIVERRREAPPGAWARSATSPARG